MFSLGSEDLPCSTTGHPGLSRPVSLQPVPDHPTAADVDDGRQLTSPHSLAQKYTVGRYYKLWIEIFILVLDIIVGFKRNLKLKWILAHLSSI